MATLYERLFVDDDSYDAIATHYFYAALVDMAAGETTKAQIINAFDLDTTAQDQLDLLIAAYVSATDKRAWLDELHAVMMLAGAGLKYNSPSAFATRMGL